MSIVTIRVVSNSGALEQEVTFVTDLSDEDTMSEHVHDALAAAGLSISVDGGIHHDARAAERRAAERQRRICET